MEYADVQTFRGQDADDAARRAAPDQCGLLDLCVVTVFLAHIPKFSAPHREGLSRRN